MLGHSECKPRGVRGRHAVEERERVRRSAAGLRKKPASVPMGRPQTRSPPWPSWQCLRPGRGGSGVVAAMDWPTRTLCMTVIPWRATTTAIVV